MEPNKVAIATWCNYLEGKGPRKFLQGHGALHFSDGDDEKRCCLGVACQAAIDNGVEMEVVKSEASLGDAITYDTVVAVLPEAVQEWLGIPSNDPQLIGEPDREDSVTCISANDNARLSFKQIAQAIRERYLEDK